MPFPSSNSIVGSKVRTPSSSVNRSNSRANAASSVRGRRSRAVTSRVWAESGALANARRPAGARVRTMPRPSADDRLRCTIPR